jgi:hypothetical protein
MASKAKVAAPVRSALPLKIGREWISFGRNLVTPTGSAFALQHRLFVSDPWAVIAEAIHRALPDDRTRDIAHSFRRQAEDYFRAANIGRELAVRPVLLYYAFLNLAKAYTVAKGNVALAGKTSHGVSSPPSKPRQIQGALIRFERPTKSQPRVFQQLLNDLEGNAAVMNADLKLGRLLPQILPGHRLWCYGSRQRERFVPIEQIDLCQANRKKQVWVNIYLSRDDLDSLDMSDSTVLSESDLKAAFEIADDASRSDCVCFQQRNPESYVTDPAEAADRVVRAVRNNIWETVKSPLPIENPTSIVRRARNE